MTGIGGVVGRDRRGVDRLADGLEWSGTERLHQYEAEGVEVRFATLPGHDSDRHVASVAPITIWLWGNVYGVDGPTGYRSLAEDADPPAEAVARLVASRGTGVAARLNGDFFALVYDHDRRTASFVTDRLGTRPVYYTRTPDGTVVFASRIQALADHPAVTPSFDRDYLMEYFAYRRSFGVTTPMADVFMFPPGAVTTIDPESTAIRSDTYWRPRYRPLDRPFSYFVDEFVDRFQSAVDERVAAAGDGAMLLSGGSDSRLLAAALADHDVTAYHLADWMSREARTAERVAMTVGHEFELLRRDRDYIRTLLERTPAHHNFVQRFHQAHVEGFIDRIRTEHDYVFTNHLADVLFKDHYVPSRDLPLGPVGSPDLPVVKPVRSLDRFLDWTARSAPPYFDDSTSLRTILENNVERTGGGFRFHGVHYDSLRDLVLYHRVWPATNGTDAFFRRSLHENLVHHVPLLDTRLLDLWVTIPTKYRLRYNLVNAAIARLAPDLAAMPHANTGVPLTWSFPLDYLARYALMAARTRLPIVEETPLPWLSHGAWGDMAALIRHREFVPETLQEHATVLQRLPFLDRDGAFACYRDHVAGDEHTRELLALTTFLEMPITERTVVDSDESAADGSTRKSNIRPR